MTWDEVVALAARLPSAERAASYGTPALKVRGKLFARLREDGLTLVLRTDEYERAHLLESEPASFFLTDHYREYPWILVRLPQVTPERLAPLLEDAWRRVAPRRLVDEFDRA
jgi:hypothetical protein